MKRFVEGTDRGQSTLFPECLDDWIDEDNPVRVIDVFVDELDLGALDFGGAAGQMPRRFSPLPIISLTRRCARTAAGVLTTAVTPATTRFCERPMGLCRRPSGDMASGKSRGGA